MLLKYSFQPVTFFYWAFTRETAGYLTDSKML